MSYNREIAEKVRSALAGSGDFSEKIMFGSLGFMVDGKVIIAIGSDDSMFKIGPDLTRSKIQAHEAQPVTMSNRTMKNWVVVENSDLMNSKHFDQWLTAALSYCHAKS